MQYVCLLPCVPLYSLLSIIISIYSLPVTVICCCNIVAFYSHFSHDVYIDYVLCVALLGTSEKCETIFASCNRALDLFVLVWIKSLFSLSVYSVNMRDASEFTQMSKICRNIIDFAL